MALKDALARYRPPRLGCALWQLSTTLTLLALLWVTMWYSLSLHYAVTLLLAAPTALVLVRVFVLQHDCGHESLFPSPSANHVTGFVLALFTMTPYHRWRRNHALHHA